MGRIDGAQATPTAVAVEVRGMWIVNTDGSRHRIVKTRQPSRLWSRDVISPDHCLQKAAVYGGRRYICDVIKPEGAGDDVDDA